LVGNGEEVERSLRVRKSAAPNPKKMEIEKLSAKSGRSGASMFSVFQGMSTQIYTYMQNNSFMVHTTIFSAAFN